MRNNGIRIFAGSYFLRRNFLYGRLFYFRDKFCFRFCCRLFNFLQNRKRIDLNRLKFCFIRLFQRRFSLFGRNIFFRNFSKIFRRSRNIRKGNRI